MTGSTVTPLRAGLAAWAALVALQFTWYLWWAPPLSGSSLLAIALTVPPLLLPLIALRRSAERALLWVGLLALAYFTHGVVAAWTTPAARVPALLECVLAMVIIVAIGWHAFTRKRAKAL